MRVPSPTPRDAFVVHTERSDHPPHALEQLLLRADEAAALDLAVALDGGVAAVDFNAEDVSLQSPETLNLADVFNRGRKRVRTASMRLR